MKRLISALKKERIINKGNFILTSGKLSNYYLDMKKVSGNPKLFSYIASLLSAQIKSKATCIASIGFGGIPLAPPQICSCWSALQQHGIRKSSQKFY